MHAKHLLHHLVESAAARDPARIALVGGSLQLRYEELEAVLHAFAGGLVGPTVRRLGESLPGQMIRINPTEPQLGRAKGVSLARGALDAMRLIEAALNEYAEVPDSAQAFR